MTALALGVSAAFTVCAVTRRLSPPLVGAADPDHGAAADAQQVLWLEDGLRSLRDTDLEEGFMHSAGSPVEAMSQYSRMLMRLTDPERVPALQRVTEAGGVDHADDSDDELRFGLVRILDRVEALVCERGNGFRRAHRSLDALRGFSIREEIHPDLEPVNLDRELIGLGRLGDGLDMQLSS